MLTDDYRNRGADDDAALERMLDEEEERERDGVDDAVVRVEEPAPVDDDDAETPLLTLHTDGTAVSNGVRQVAFFRLPFINIVNSVHSAHFFASLTLAVFAMIELSERKVLDVHGYWIFALVLMGWSAAVNLAAFVAQNPMSRRYDHGGRHGMTFVNHAVLMMLVDSAAFALLTTFQFQHTDAQMSSFNASRHDTSVTFDARLIATFTAIMVFVVATFFIKAASQFRTWERHAFPTFRDTVPLRQGDHID